MSNFTCDRHAKAGKPNAAARYLIEVPGHREAACHIHLQTALNEQLPPGESSAAVTVTVLPKND